MGMPVDLPLDVLSMYGFKFKGGEKVNNCWRLKGENDAYYGLWEYHGDLVLLKKILKWRENLAEKGFASFLRLFKTKERENFVHTKQGKAYYLTAWPEGEYEYFDPLKKSSWRKVTEALALLHEENKKTVFSETTDNYEVVWLQAYQERLKELLVYNRYLQEKRLVNDFERLYVENFEEFYLRGQESIQRMVLAGCDQKKKKTRSFLVGDFSPENVFETDKEIIFLNTVYWPPGWPVYDLTLLLKMYLPVKQGDEDFLQEVLSSYQERMVLDEQDKQLILALLSFPSRFCFYAEQYFYGKIKPETIVKKFKNYLYEQYQQKVYLEKLENWLLGEGQ